LDDAYVGEYNLGACDMTIYNEKNGLSLFTGASDAQGDSLSLRSINGVQITQWPHALALPTGILHIAQNGQVTYDDQGGLSGHPQPGQVLENGALTYTLWDGELESPVYNASISLSGVAGGAQSTSFGVNTPAGAGGVAVLGSAITQGDPQGHFEIFGGYLVLSSAGAVNASGAYSLTLDNGDIWGVDMLPDTAHVINASQFNQAIEEAKPRITAQSQAIVIRDGSVVGSLEERILIQSAIGGGALVDPNLGASDSAYDDAARADFTGAHLVIRPETPLGAEIRGRMECLGCDNVKLSGLRFTTHVAPSEPLGYYYDDNTSGDPSKTADYTDRALCSTTRALQITVNANHSHRGYVIVEDCSFGAPSGVAPGHFCQSIQARYSSVVLQGNDFNRCWSAVALLDLDRARLVDNLFRDYLEDCVQAVYHIEAGTIRIEASNNYFLEPMVSQTWAGAHCDAIQLGTPADTRNYSIYYSNNIVAMMSGSYTAGTQPAVVSGGTISHTSVRATQGFFSNFGSSLAQASGTIRNNFVMINAYWGINVDNGNGVDVYNNTVVRDFTSTPKPFDLTEAFFNFRGDCINCSASGNICANLTAEPGASVTMSNNYTALDSKSQLTNSYGVCFEGAFTYSNGSVNVPLDTSSRAAARASVDSIFAPKAGGPGQGRGHLA
jgi:hypothetical protein